MSTKKPIKRALISVYDKSGLTELAAFLHSKNVLVISTGGTAEYLRKLDLQVTDLSTVGHFKEILDGRVKSLNPRVHAGILFDRNNLDHLSCITELDIAPIDLVVVNLYPFESTALQKDASIEKLIEQIDIGGVALLRAAAKNYQHVAALEHPNKYREFMDHYETEGSTTLQFRQQCALNVFQYTHHYDQQIAHTLANRFALESTMSTLSLELKDKKELRYGENPHQRAQIYRSENGGDLHLSAIEQIAGKEMSYNNYLDTHAAIWALRCVADSQSEHQSCAVVIKHGTPCGAAIKERAALALEMAIASDSVSAFGGIIAVSEEFDEACFAVIESGFFEVIIAPSFSQAAEKRLKSKKNLRWLSIDNLMTGALDMVSFRSIFGSMLRQEFDTSTINKDVWTTVTKKKPLPEQILAMELAFRVAKATPSNAITIAHKNQLLGVGAGQPNRIQSAKIAIDSALSRGFNLENAALGSDAFFPFTDCLELCDRHGIKLVIQPGGSIRDVEVIKKADELSMCMVFTHSRHFRH